ncbi:aminoglycoside phosphotransferase [Spongiactinospora gelatinilytica]|uniref:Aminoglycoside phosphotransferase n=1 Tax=Spongiactinospora gelatinilytica TaxID=2666298 RepID=A0A2W2HXP6_9ACTN|nr:phosphotransferase [Spongiactinospora gelatinilytica]PZG56285.1 aminoglycoside phosphotransferase [Spongiactinospora gelatinilytica]
MSPQDEIAAPLAAGVRLPWHEVPPAVRAAVEAHLGGRVVEAVTQIGGFSPAAAARLRLADGRRAFVKAVGSDVNPHSRGMYLEEAEISAALPATAPAPPLRAAFDTDGWVALVFDDVDGRQPTMPWRPDELARVLGALGELARVPAPPALPALADRLARAFVGWRRLAGGEDVTGLHPWAVRHLDTLAAIEADWPLGVAGETLVHADIRADNVLLTADRVVIVDWAWASRGAAWFDLVQMLPSVRMQGGPPPQEVLAGHPLGRAADPGAVTAVVAALAEFMLRMSRRPDPPGLPTVRAFQRAQGIVALDWLRARTGWPD